MPPFSKLPLLKQGLVISDLHLFSRRSVGEQLLEEMCRECREIDLLVLNGDTFDFRWSCHSSEEASLKAASDWLGRCSEIFPGKEIHFILGNHDCLRPFRDEVERLSRSIATLHFHEHHLQLGRLLFLHGDCANRGMSKAKLDAYREFWSKDRQRGEAGRKFYDVVDATGAGKLFHRLYFPQAATVKRVATYLDEVFPDWRSQYDDCYFGHTHMPFRDHEHEGVRFHNSGSAVRGMGFQPLNFTFGEKSALPPRGADFD